MSKKLVEPGSKLSIEYQLVVDSPSGKVVLGAGEYDVVSLNEETVEIVGSDNSYSAISVNDIPKFDLNN